jgi:hypothetical protein
MLLPYRPAHTTTGAAVMSSFGLPPDGMPVAKRSTYSIEEVATLLGIGRNAAYLAAGRDFPVIKIGKRKVVPRVAIDRMLNPVG